MFKVPIVYVCFNRPKLTKKTFECIKKIKPSKLFLILDGPRKNNKQDKINCLKVKKIIQNINWKCKLYKNFSKENLGLQNRFFTGLDWVFNNTNEAIILEDDCLPHNDFFYFCEAMLKKYKHSNKVKLITGNNFQNSNKIEVNEDYYFSKYSHIWGWATWKKTWLDVKRDDTFWKNKIFNSDFEMMKSSTKEKKYWKNMYYSVLNNKLNSWAIYLLFSIWNNKGLTVTPKINLIKNLGLSSGTNTKNLDIKLDISNKSLNKPLVHPKIIKVNFKKDLYVFNTVYNKNLFSKLKLLFTKYINALKD